MEQQKGHAAGKARHPIDDVPGQTGFAIDDADAMADAGAGADADAGADEATLLHLLNATAEARLPVLLAARTPPARWPVRLPDLASRLRAITAVGSDWLAADWLSVAL